MNTSRSLKETSESDEDDLGFAPTPEQHIQIHSAWHNKTKKRFNCYYGMNEAKFVERSNDMQINRGYELVDVSVYLDKFSNLKFSAIWHQTEP